jgi:hypothetical protein
MQKSSQKLLFAIVGISLKNDGRLGTGSSCLVHFAYPSYSAGIKAQLNGVYKNFNQEFVTASATF